MSRRRLSGLSLLIAIPGVLLQLVAGVADYPTIPPVLVVLPIGALVTLFVRGRWAPIAAVAVGLFLVVGLFAAGQAGRLIDVTSWADTIGLWIQLVGVTVAAGAGLAACAGTPDTGRNARAET